MNNGPDQCSADRDIPPIAILLKKDTPDITVTSSGLFCQRVNTPWLHLIGPTPLILIVLHKASTLDMDKYQHTGIQHDNREKLKPPGEWDHVRSNQMCSEQSHDPFVSHK